MKDNIRVLIIGASGRVGKEIQFFLKHKSNYETFGTCYNSKIDDLIYLDMTNQILVEKIFKKIKPSIVIHAAGMIHPLQCEENHELAWNTNVSGTKNIVNLCKDYNSKLIYLSSDYVFDGLDNPYDELHETNPLNFYGKTKTESEKLISELNNFLIVRTAWVNDFDENSKSFVMQVVNSLKNNKIFYAPSDQYGHPTLSINLAEIVVELLDKNYNGVFNVTGLTYIDRFHFAKKIAKTFSLNPNLIQKTSTKELNQSITRPLRLNLNLEKIKSHTSTKILTLDEQLDIMKNQSNQSFKH